MWVNGRGARLELDCVIVGGGACLMREASSSLQAADARGADQGAEGPDEAAAQQHHPFSRFAERPPPNACGVYVECSGVTF
eukprot:1194334-Prorocentrum_minimum.AAC.3